MLQTNHTARYLFLAFAATVVAIRALTSLSFFATFLPSLLPATVASASGSSVISGFVGVVLLDAACLVWLKSANNAETAEQRSVANIAAILTFCGSALASVAYLSLDASRLELSPQATSTIELVALVGVIAAIVLNFGVAILFSQNSQDAQAHRRDTRRRHTVASAEHEQAERLDLLVASGVTAELERQAPDLAKEQATRLASAFFKKEGERFPPPTKRAS